MTVTSARGFFLAGSELTTATPVEFEDEMHRSNKQQRDNERNTSHQQNKPPRSVVRQYSGSEQQQQQDQYDDSALHSARGEPRDALPPRAPVRHLPCALGAG